MRFITKEDYTPLIRDEIKTVLLQGYSDFKLLRAEDMAVAQVKNYLCGRYDTGKIFQSLPLGAQVDFRNAHIIMIVIDCALYHLYTSVAPERMPRHREQRYEDALRWLEAVASAKGGMAADLPSRKDEKGENISDFRISYKKRERCTRIRG